MQKNFDIRRNQPTFKSKTGRSKITGNKKFVVPPVGLYEHKFMGATQAFNKATSETLASNMEGQTIKSDSSPKKGNPEEISMKYITKPREK